MTDTDDKLLTHTKDLERFAKLLHLAPALLSVIWQETDVSMKDIISWECQLHAGPKDATLRLVYADWLADRGLTVRESQVRQEAWAIDNDNHFSGTVVHTGHDFEVNQSGLWLITIRYSMLGVNI